MTTGTTRLQLENKLLTRNTSIAEPRETSTTSKITTQKKTRSNTWFSAQGDPRPHGTMGNPWQRLRSRSRVVGLFAPHPPPAGAYNERTLKAFQKTHLFSQGNLFWYPTNSFQFTFSLSWASSPKWMYGWLSSIGLGNIQRDQVTPFVGAQ